MLISKRVFLSSRQLSQKQPSIAVKIRNYLFPVLGRGHADLFLERFIERRYGTETEFIGQSLQRNRA